MRRRFNIEPLEDRCTPAVNVVAFTNDAGIFEQRLIQDGFHLASVVYPQDRVAAFRPHPDLTDINGFGTTLQLAPFLGGGDAVSERPVVTANNPANTFTIQVSGLVNRTPTTTYGTWTETLTIQFNPVTQTITGTGTLSIALTGTLTAAAADLNLGRIKSNYLDNVPLRPTGVGDTGDMKRIDVIYGPNMPPNFSWIPTDGDTFPTTLSQSLTLNTVGDVNVVDTAAMGFDQIAIARKPSLSVTYTADLPAHALSAGLDYDTLLSQDPFADNVGAVPLLLRTTTTDTILDYTIDLQSTPVDIRLPNEPLLASGPLEGFAALYPREQGSTAFDSQTTGTVSPFGAIPVSLRSATADVNGDTIPDLVLVTGPGTPIRLAVLSGADNTTLLVAPFDPFGGDFSGGGFVSAADINGDGRDEFAVSPDQGGGPRVSIYSLMANGTVSRRVNFLGIDDANFRGGVRTSLGDVNNDGTPDLAVSAGFSGGPRTALFSGATLFSSPTRLVNDFFAFPGADATTLRNGVFVASGDINGDGFAELIFGGGPGGAPRVFILSGSLISANNVFGAQAAPVANFFVGGNSQDRGGVRVAVKNVDDDAKADLAVGSGEGAIAKARIYRGSSFTTTREPAAFQDILLFQGVAMAEGVYVG